LLAVSWQFGWFRRYVPSVGFVDLCLRLVSSVCAFGWFRRSVPSVGFVGLYMWLVVLTRAGFARGGLRPVRLCVPASPEGAYGPYANACWLRQRWPTARTLTRAGFARGGLRPVR